MSFWGRGGKTATCSSFWRGRDEEEEIARVITIVYMMYTLHHFYNEDVFGPLSTKARCNIIREYAMMGKLERDLERVVFQDDFLVSTIAQATIAIWSFILVWRRKC